MKTNFPLSRKDNLVVQELNDETLIYDLNINKAFCLNETSALVWRLCDGTRSVKEICQSLNKKLKTFSNEDVVWLALDQLKNENLLINSEYIPNTFEGMSRREVIKKVGLSSMITFPLVSIVIAPTAAHASSTCSDALGPGGTSGSGGECYCRRGTTNVGQTCLQGLASEAPSVCKPGCICTRTQANVPAGGDTNCGTANARCVGKCS